MTEHPPEDFERLDRAIASIRDVSPDAPPEDLVTSTVEVLQEKENSRPADPLAAGQLSRRELMFRFAKYGSLGTAASIALIAFGITVLNSLTSQPAFAQVIQNVRDATGARYVLRQKIGSQPAMECVSSFQGDLVRTEVPEQFIHLANIRTREMLQLVPSTKQAFQGKVGGKPLDGPFDLAAVMKQMTEDSGRRIEETREDGKQIDVYRVDKLPDFSGKARSRKATTSGSGSTAKRNFLFASSFVCRPDLKAKRRSKWSSPSSNGIRSSNPTTSICPCPTATTCSRSQKLPSAT